MSRTFLIIIFGGLAAVYMVANLADSLIRRGAAELDRDTLDKVWRREAARAGLWKTVETIAFVCLLGGLAIIFRIIKLNNNGAFWGYGTLAVGMAVFCLGSVLRAWISHSAYAAEAPNSKASSGARTGAVLTTMAEFVLGGAVCWYVFTHVNFPSSSSNMTSTPPPSTATSNSTTSTAITQGSSTQTPRQPAYVGQAEAVDLLGKNVKFLKALAERKDIRSREQNGVTEYHRDDIIKTRRDGMPSAEELGLDPEPDKN